MTGGGARQLLVDGGSDNSGNSWLDQPAEVGNNNSTTGSRGGSLVLLLVLVAIVGMLVAGIGDGGWCYSKWGWH